MAITYRWGISQLKRTSSPNPDTVNEIDAYLYGEDENGKLSLIHISEPTRPY